MDLATFCRELPKIELHAHLNGSLSPSTMLALKRYYADSGMTDNTNAFTEYGAGDAMNLSDCFQIFGIAHSLTTTPQALQLAASLTLKEFQEDGCCYIELRSTPRDTPFMTKREYIETLVSTIIESSRQLTIISRLIISINRIFSVKEAEEIAALAIEYYKTHPDVVVGIELSGNPTLGKFQDFMPALSAAREAGLKVTLHCGEVYNPTEIQDMLNFMPQRIGHGTFIHPRLGGTEETWSTLCKSKIPVEICLTSNVNTKSLPDYESHHFKELYDSGVPVIICTDDKGVFATSLSQEYKLCADTFGLSKSQMAKLALTSCQYVFSDGTTQKTLHNKLLNFVEKYAL